MNGEYMKKKNYNKMCEQVCEVKSTNVYVLCSDWKQEEEKRQTHYQLAVLRKKKKNSLIFNMVFFW